MDYDKTIKTFSSRRQAIAKRRISDLASDLEKEQINEDRFHSNTSSSTMSPYRCDQNQILQYSDENEKLYQNMYLLL